MRTGEALDTPEAWAAAHERRRRCARADCANERLPVEEGADYCFACTLEAELFDRDARWAGSLARPVHGLVER